MFITARNLEIKPRKLANEKESEQISSQNYKLGDEGIMKCLDTTPESNHVFEAVDMSYNVVVIAPIILPELLADITSYR